MSRHIVAAVQMTSTANKAENLAIAERLVRRASKRGAQLVAIPELFNCLGEPETIVANAEPIPGPTSQLMGQLAAELGITLVAGSIGEQTESKKICNTSLIFGPDGSPLAKYQKVHLFDIDLPGRVTFRESDFMTPGEVLAITETEVGQLAQATCYDIRFPNLFQLYADRGAEIIVTPSAFTLPTGRDHWEVLLRARAIENQVFIVAPNQFGKHGGELNSYGRSMIIDPWGTVLAKAADGEGVITAEIDFDSQKQIRSRLPCLQHRRDLDQL